VVVRETEAVLKREMAEVGERLETLVLFKKREQFNHRQTRDKSGYKLEQAESQLEKFKTELQELRVSLKEADDEVAEQCEVRLAKHRAAMVPLEEARDEVLKRLEKADQEIERVMAEKTQRV